MGTRQLPHCKQKNCEHNINGRCKILTSTDFNGRECPFFRKKEDKDDDK